MVEELLSRNPHTENDSTHSYAEGALMESARICMGQVEPDQVSEEITFDDSLKLWLWGRQQDQHAHLLP